MDETTNNVPDEINAILEKFPFLTYGTVVGRTIFGDRAKL